MMRFSLGVLAIFGLLQTAAMAETVSDEELRNLYPVLANHQYARQHDPRFFSANLVCESAIPLAFKIIKENYHELEAGNPRMLVLAVLLRNALKAVHELGYYAHHPESRWFTRNSYSDVIAWHLFENCLYSINEEAWNSRLTFGKEFPLIAQLLEISDLLVGAYEGNPLLNCAIRLATDGK